MRPVFLASAFALVVCQSALASVTCRLSGLSLKESNLSSPTFEAVTIRGATQSAQLSKYHYVVNPAVGESLTKAVPIELELGIVEGVLHHRLFDLTNVLQSQTFPRQLAGGSVKVTTDLDATWRTGDEFMLDLHCWSGSAMNTHDER